MNKGWLLSGYFVVAVAFFVLGRLTAANKASKEQRLVAEEVPKETVAQAAPPRQEVMPLAPPREALANVGPVGDPSPAIGPESAKVIVLEVSDFQCPVCKRAYGPLKQIVQDFPGQVRLVFKHNPLKMHRNALNAAAASIAAARQGKFWEYADILFENQGALTEPDLFNYAARLGLDMERFKKDYADPAIRARALAEGESAMDLGAKGTPAFFVNGRLQVGWASYEALKQMVQQELVAMDAAMASGASVREARLQRVRATLQDAERFLASPLGKEFM